MARRSSRRSSRRTFGGFNPNSLLNGALGGAAARVGAGYLGPAYGPAAGFAAVGLLRKDDTLTTLAGVSIGSQLAGGLKLPGMTGGMDAGGLL